MSHTHAVGAAAGTEAIIRQRLLILAPKRLEVVDESSRHAGHAGARSGGHYRLLLVSAAFTGQPRLARHRLVHAALGDLMRTRIHALSIQALSPEEDSSAVLLAS